MDLDEIVEKYMGKWVLLSLKGKCNRMGPSEVKVIAHGKRYKDIEEAQKESKEHTSAVFVTESLISPTN